MKKRRIRSTGTTTVTVLVALTAAIPMTTTAVNAQDAERVVVSVGGRNGLLNQRGLPTVQTPHRYQGEALRLHDKYLHAGLTKRNVFRSSRQFSPFGNVFRSSRHYEQKLAASADAYPLRTIGHPMRVIGNNYDEVVPPAFIAGSGGYGSYGEPLSPFDAAHHYYDSELISPVPFFDHYGPSTFVNNRDSSDPNEVAPAAPIEWRTNSGDVDDDASQQAVTVRVRQPDGTRKIIITSEPIPSHLGEAWAALARSDDADAAAQFRQLTNPGGHATDLARQARLGLIIAQAALVLEGSASADVVSSSLELAVEDDPHILTRLPQDAQVGARIAELAARFAARARTDASAASNQALAEAFGKMEK